MHINQTPPRIIFTVYANETLEQTEQLAMDKNLSLYECISHTDFKPAFTLMQIRSVNENIGEEGVGEWAIRDASDWACNKFNEVINENCNHGQYTLDIRAIYDPERRYSSWFVFNLLSRLITKKDRFRVDQDVHIDNEDSFNEWSDKNLVDEQGNPVSA